MLTNFLILLRIEELWEAHMHALLDPTEIRRTLRGTYMFKYELEFWIALESHWSLFYHHYKHIRNWKSYKEFDVMINIRNEPSQLLWRYLITYRYHLKCLYDFLLVLHRMQKNLPKVLYEMVDSVKEIQIVVWF